MGKEGILTVDLHGCNQYQARIRLDSAFRRVGREVYRIRVIHGHNGGTVLRELTRAYENHPKVKRMIAAEGDTTFILREI